MCPLEWQWAGRCSILRSAPAQPRPGAPRRLASRAPSPKCGDEDLRRFRSVQERGQAMLKQVGMGFQDAQHGFAVELPDVVLADDRDRKASAHHLKTFLEAQHLVL